MAQTRDPFVGRWALDTRQSKYPQVACPKQMTIEMTTVGDAIHYHSVTVLENGTAFSADYTASYNDVPTMVTGAKGVLLPVSLHKDSTNEVTASYKSGFETRATSRRVVSEDGKTMTVTTTSHDGAGNVSKNIGVYRKIDAAPKVSFDLSKANVSLEPAK